MTGSGSASSTWAPLRIGLFRTLWIAALVINVGGWMQTVGAQWLLVRGPHAAVLVSSCRPLMPCPPFCSGAELERATATCAAPDRIDADIENVHSADP